MSIDTTIPLSMGLGLLTFYISFHLSQFLSPRISNVYHRLKHDDPSQRLTWDGKITSTQHAIISVLCILYVYFFTDTFVPATSPKLQVPFVRRTSTLSTSTLAFSGGYFIADLIMMILHPRAFGGTSKIDTFLLLIHHTMAMAGVLGAAATGIAHGYTLATLFTELTTPFLNLRWLLHTEGLKDSRIYLLNGLLMVKAWLIARVGLFLYLFKHLTDHYPEIIAEQLPTWCLVILFGGPPILFVMNVFWLVKIVQGAVKLLRKSSAGSGKKKD